MFFKRLLSLLIASIILFAESGQVVYAHTCFKSNETSFSLYSPAHCNDEKIEKSCCAKKQQITPEACVKGKESCCGVSSKYVQQSFPTHETELKKPVAAKSVFSALSFYVTTPGFVPTVVTACVASSPPLIVQYFASFLCVFRC
jgi:hypothetical protein